MQSPASVFGGGIYLGLAERFQKRFRGSTRAYGWYDLRSTPETSGKQQGQAYTMNETLDPQKYREHLEGRAGLGVVPIQDDDTCWWGVIDIDEYGADFEAAKVAVSIYADAAQRKWPLVITRSKSGGLHVWIFFSEPVLAGAVMKKMAAIAAALGYPGVEVFPKQASIRNPRDPSKPRLGNWINLPYFNGKNTNRYGFGILGDELSLEEFLNYADSKETTPRDFKAINANPASDDDMPFADGPPCLQKMARQRVPEGGRDNSMYQMGVYLLKKGLRTNELSDAMGKLNQKFFDPPLPPQQIMKIVHSVDGNKDYHYKCNDAPMRDYCNRSECIRRPHGVSDGAGAGVSIDFGELTKYVNVDSEGLPTDNPAYWELTINDVVLKFEDEELMTFGAVKKRVFSTLDLVLPDTPKARWEDHLRGLLVSVNRVLLPHEISFEGQFLEALRGFVVENCEADELREIRNGLVYYETTEDTYYFQLKYFLSFARDSGMRTTAHKAVAVLREAFKAESKTINRSGYNSTAVALSSKVLNLSDVTGKPKFKKDDDF